MRPNTLIICLVIVTATITSATNLFAQDIDTLDWDEIVELADTAFRESLDTIYLLEDEYTSGESYRTGFETTCLSGGISMSINLNKTLKERLEQIIYEFKLSIVKMKKFKFKIGGQWWRK